MKHKRYKLGLCIMSLFVVSAIFSPMKSYADRRGESKPFKGIVSKFKPLISTTDMSTTTPTDLAQTLVGSGVAIDNVVYTGADVAAGTFSGGIADDLGIESGIVLCSGVISNANGPNDSDSISASNGTPGDSDLDALIIGTTYDAAVLEFDFVPNFNTIHFEYVFGSDEYNEYVGAFNDAFAFYLNELNASKENIALIPNTDTPVSINNVNLDVNSAYYNNNDPSDLDPVPFNTELDGFTTVLTADAEVTPGSTYHIKLTIADTGDDVQDSFAFIKAESFTSGSPEPSPSPSPSPTPTEPPTVISLASFTAKADSEGNVILNWETASEIDNAGFNVYRARLKNGDYRKVNKQIIAAKGSASAGASYSLVNTPDNEGTYFYKLEDVDSNGVSTMHGPVKVRVSVDN